MLLQAAEYGILRVMNFARLLEVVGEEPVFETGLLLAGDVDPVDVRRQLSRWTRAGKLVQLRRSVYSLAPPYRKIAPHPFVLANWLRRGSYVSLQSALAHHGLIPELVPVVTSVTTGRPARWRTPEGRFDFRHLDLAGLGGSPLVEVAPQQRAYVATPEKALVDLLRLQAGSDSPDYLEELRLQNLGVLDLAVLSRWIERAGSRKLDRAVRIIRRLALREAAEYRTA
jgi:hypothetical protein